MALTQLKTGAIADDAVTTAKLAAGTDGHVITYDASGNPTTVGPGTDGQVLTSTGAGSPPAFEAIPASDVVSDTSPQLGGNLASNGNDILIADNDFVKFGTDNDCTIKHSGSHAILENTTGALYGRSDEILLQSNTGNENYVTATLNGAVEVYHDGSKKFETLSTGVRAQGGIAFGSDTAAANHLDDYEEGTFTPTMTFDTHQSNPAGTFTAQYQKVGNIVHFHARFALSDEGSGMNSIHLSNLPFTPNVSSYTHPIATFYAEQGVNTGGANNMVFGKLVTNAYQFKVCEIHGSGNLGHFHMNMTEDTSIFGLYGSYFTSS